MDNAKLIAELLPCPFCGREGPLIGREYHHSTDGHTFPPTHYVICGKAWAQDGCGARTAGKDDATAAERWNRRAALSAQSEPEPLTGGEFDRMMQYKAQKEAAMGEPVAWMHNGTTGCDATPDHIAHAKVKALWDRVDPKHLEHYTIPLYAHPVASAQVPPYPTGNVNGPCVCGSWPGGPCFRCPRLAEPGATEG